MNAKLVTLTVLLVCSLGFIGWFFYEAMISPIGPPNPAIGVNAICSIQKDKNGIYTVACTHNIPDGSFYVAKSSDNLDQYLGKNVSIEAIYLPNKSNTDAMKTNTQCVANKCQQIFSDKNKKTYAIIIEKVKEL
ncbi:MAG: hypothetical protein HY425_00730 [Candidatus Levybacteria bacterium]|nr:hypothetical protein [Candidatus Levybacteria bacterium]